MALIMKYIDGIQEIFDRNGDPRTSKWPLMSSPFPTLLICLSYVYIVKVLGPKIMENRKPFQLKELLIAYNLFQVIFSAWLFYELGVSGWFTGHYSLRCQPVDYSASKRTVRMVHVCWWYYFSKFTEFMDTIFFVLRKKNEHISTLHVIHHGCMPMSVWFGVKFTPGGHSTFFGLLNTFVHIIMYSYYLLAALGPSVQRYLWWKKYLTSLQMAQFIAIMVHAFQLLFIDCNYPKAFVWWIGLHAVMFFFLFKEFYRQSYMRSSMKKANGTSSLKQAVMAAATVCTPDQHVHQNGKINITNNKLQQQTPATAATNGHAKNYSKPSDYYATGELNGSTLHHRRVD